MSNVISSIQTALPVFLALILGMLCRKTGFVSRDRQMRKAMQSIAGAAETLITHPDPRVSQVAAEILSQAKGFEE